MVRGRILPFSNLARDESFENVTASQSYNENARSGFDEIPEFMNL